MRKLWKRALSAALVVLTVALTVSSAIVSASANETVLSNDTETAANDVNTLMAGIDISGWQENVNWSSVKSAGVEFAMLRLTSYSSASHSYVEDPMLASHISGAKSQGIHIGGYFFSYAKSVDEVRAEANMVIGILKKYQQTFSFPIVFDAESTNIQSFATDACVVFREILEENGYYVMIYANNNWFNNYIGADRIAGCDLWQAYYPWTTSTSGIEKYRGYTPAQAKSIDFSTRKAMNANNEFVFMWQITDEGTVSGIGTNNVDIDICIRDYSQIIPVRGFNDFPASTTHTHTFTNGSDPSYHYQICSCGTKQNIVAHSFSAGSDSTYHYQACSCGYKKDVTSHSYVAQYKNGTEHESVCSCGKVGETAEHEFEYVITDSGHKLECSCGYVQPSSDEAHIYNVVTPESDNHISSCICGAVKGSGAGEAHTWILKYNDDEHYKVCRECGFVDKASKQAHDISISKADENNHWLECECGKSGERSAHTSKTEKCTECGYHYHQPRFDDREHWVVCETCPLKTRAELHWLDDDGCCTECGYKKEMTCKHKMKNGTCSECGYHEHQYTYDDKMHTISCGCSVTNAEEEHVLGDDGACTVCEYGSKKATESLPSTDEDEYDDYEDMYEEEVGCDASVGATAVLGCVVAFGGALVFRKKEDN